MNHQGQSQFEWTEENISSLIESCRKYIRKLRWRHQGRSIQGADCIGLFYLAAKDIGCILDMPTNYTLDPSHKNLQICMKSLCNEIHYKAVRPGDFGLVRYSGKPTHLMMFTDRGMLHSSSDTRWVTEHSIDEAWKRSIVSCWSIRGRQLGR